MKIIRKISDIGIDFIDDVEGREKFEYPDTEGNPTIGIGHLLTRSELTSGKIIIKGIGPVIYRNGLSDYQMDALLEQDLDPVENIINDLVIVSLTQYQFDSLCSFIFNVGNGAFQTSTLLKVLNQSKYGQVPTQMRRWNKSRKDGVLVVNPGLVNRREKDIQLWINCWRRAYSE